ncbi:MAG: FtsX-like permease family protein [candidate division Zixibacteria bacterium]|nr:FtsX-like permease family protein [candidate division Zixibacteria bacterium]
MKILKLAIKNAFRHKLRTGLTVLGLAVAVMAFGLLRTVINAWYAGAEAAPPDRLVARNAVNIIFPLPLAYRDQIAKVPGVEKVTYAHWFGAYYVDPKNFFANFAIDHNTYFEIYPEFVLDSAALATFHSEKTAAICGQILADRFGWKVGDRIRLIGTIYPGNWDLHLVGIYRGQKKVTDESAFLLRWDMLDENLRATVPGRAGKVGWYIMKISNPADGVSISRSVDALFKNSLAETLTETEEAFQLSFIAMSSAIITGLQLVSYLIIGIILLVLANTMAMTARERISEYAVLKTLGFRPLHLVSLIAGESLFIAAVGGVLGMLLIYPMAGGFGEAMKYFFPVFEVKPITVVLAGAFAVVVGVLASVFPILRATRVSIVDGLRVVG